METVQERDARIAELEQRRAARRAESERPVEIAPGRGDLRYTSVQTVASPLNAMPFPIFGTGTRDYIWTVDGRTVSFARIFAEQPWVAAAVMRMLTWCVRVPLKVYRRVGEDDRVRLRPDDHPLAAAIEQPWESGYPAALTMALLGSLLVHGNTVMEVLEGRSGKIEFGEQDWRYLSPVQPSRNEISGWTVAADLGTRARTFSADTALHVKWWSPLGPEGVSPLQQLGTTISIEDAAQRYMRMALKNGARPPSAIQASTDFLGLDKEVREVLLAQLREDVTELYAGPENSGRPALLPPGLEWKPVGHSAQEAELINTRFVDREEVAAVYQIPPPMLGDLRRATFSNITELRQVAYTDGLGPPLVLIEQVMTSHILRTLLREDDTYVEFDFAAVLRGDFLKEINALRGAISMGLLTPHEGRSVINRPRTDEPAADKLWMPFNNLQPIGTVPVKFQKTPLPAPGDKPQQPPGKQPPPQKAPSGFVVVEDWRSHVEREQLEAAVAEPDSEGAIA